MPICRAADFSCALAALARAVSVPMNCRVTVVMAIPARSSTVRSIVEPTPMAARIELALASMVPW